jgi:pyruvate kinase
MNLSSTGWKTRTKIVATLGPASLNEPILTTLLESGVDVCRINCSHADHDSVRAQVARIRRAAHRAQAHVAILLDLQGPKIRTGPAKQPVSLQRGDTLTIVMDETFEAREKRVGTTYPEMAKDVKVGDRVLFADGALGGKVSALRLDSAPPEVDILMEVGGELGSHKGINLPGIEMSVPSLTEKDKADLEVGLDVGVDYVALSFVRRVQDIHDLRDLMRAHGKEVPIIAKIEKPEALDNIDAICGLANGVMVARGDLGVELSIEKLPVAQKLIIQAAHRAGCLCITATQMLDSMERNPTPTRAETTDVANAILDGTDAVMLSGETAIGKYPVQAVQMMDSIAREVESSQFIHPTNIEDLPELPGTSGIVSRAACHAIVEGNRPLLVFTWTGASARFASKVRPRGPIFALTPNPQIADQLALVWGVEPVLISSVETTDDLISMGEKVLLEQGHIEVGQEIVILAGRSPRKETANLLKIHEAGQGS